MSRGGANRPKRGSHRWANEVVCDGCGKAQANRKWSGDEFAVPCRYGCGSLTATYAHPA